MNMPNFKDILQKLSVFKNNLSLLVPVIITLVSVLMFIPTQLMSSKLKKDVEQESINNGGKKIKSLEKSAVSRQQYEMEAERQKAHAADANEIAKLAIQNTRRELLSYDIFPAPEPNGFSGLIFQQFGQNFRSNIDKLVLSVKGRDCPTDTEIQRGLENSSLRNRSKSRGSSMMPYSTTSSSRTSSSRGYSGMGLYGGGGSMMFASVDRMIVDEMCKDRAKTISVYVNPLDISGYEYWADYKYDVKQEDAIEDCWYHQLAYWIVDDIFQTIAKMNSGHDNVLTAPAKRFMSITFTMGLKRPRSGSGGGGVSRGFRRSVTKKQNEDADRPAYVRNDKEGLSESCTGRSCGKDIHVTHFNFSVIVSSKSVLPFMKELCSAKEHQFRGYPDGNEPPQEFKHNQITILESKIGSINPNDQMHRYYRYGDENVVSLDLICEYIFDVGGYDILIPEPVKKTLAGEDEVKK
ncbi:MAG: hypothetical protein A2168_08950 [Planctomycetes bacterium RBG_13_50_24]|nr:MAG: hypothetical protein A2168_08950 [Planctomycetes bacterium RBG_13_50_24]